MKYLILIESTKSGPGPKLVEKLLNKNITPVLMTNSPSKYEWLNESVLILPFSEDFEQIHSIISDFAKDHMIIGITTTRDEFTYLSAELAFSLGLPSQNKDAVHLCQYKNEQKSILMRKSIPTPKFLEIKNFDNYNLDFIDSISLPVIVKPARGYASFGISLCNTNEELNQYFLNLKNKDDTTDTDKVSILIEEFINGEEYSVEVFDGIAIGIIKKRMSQTDLFSETGYIANPDITKSVKNTLILTAENAAKALDLCWGPIHIDLMLKNDEAYIIEVNPRIAGSFISELINDTYQFDLVECLIKKTIGEPVCLPTKKLMKERVAMVDFIFEPTDSIVCELFNHQTFYLNNNNNNNNNDVRIRIGPRKWTPKNRVYYIYCSYDK
ncbi:ATP-grasp domain-containing protein [Xenorhabdus bovienii]|uniref:ATP-grasp domain-containing protein n=1 Tax=Xenorhabdus bovienii TaxID=40576 RepID=UPI0023B23AE9|nr:ATP-grasp domain-containing protein [Xenorhabdus bovienii]MDE9453247.1 ATP-grasp domain-containing protein [Xenorhabdus bovienii]